MLMRICHDSISVDFRCSLCARFQWSVDRSSLFLLGLHCGGKSSMVHLSFSSIPSGYQRSSKVRFPNGIFLRSMRRKTRTIIDWILEKTSRGICSEIKQPMRAEQDVNDDKPYLFLVYPQYWFSEMLMEIHFFDRCDKIEKISSFTLLIFYRSMTMRTNSSALSDEHQIKMSLRFLIDR